MCTFIRTILYYQCNVYHNPIVSSKPQPIKTSSVKYRLFPQHGRRRADMMPNQTCPWPSNIQCLVRDYGLWMRCPQGIAGTWPANSHRETKERDTKKGPCTIKQASARVLASVNIFSTKVMKAFGSNYVSPLKFKYWYRSSSGVD